MRQLGGFRVAIVARRESRRDQRSGGQALIEMALLLPILVVLVFAGIDFSRGYLAHNAMTNSVREGARFGLVHPQCLGSADDTKTECSTLSAPRNVRARVLQELTGATVTLTANDIKVTYIDDTGKSLDPDDPITGAGARSAMAGRANTWYIKVVASYKYVPMTPILSKFLGSGYTLNAAVTMAIE
jgi:Flp pilus assembly protein TadG